MTLEDSIRENLSYNPETGELRWLKPRPGRQLKKPAGHEGKDGYRRIMLDGKMLLAHRVAWFLHHEKWPEKYIDHKDKNPRHNWIDNLREATHTENMNNSHAKWTNVTGVRGIDIRPSGKVTLRLRGKYLGTFETVEEAKRFKEKWNEINS